ncbi:hypothetical protein EUTSA_v10027791mg [Eutrema salsugineum]|uniref:Uncharacterized protein n=1 Tax=Eutrema salsugineum TaxID=72664 RepID=V4M4W3_EUTSA|nr:probable transcription factor At4g00390 [Eutrema salsugineum]ESQ47333.1 hypothetical protein EUTSA_v10027791mg [Eutrema salsugineum]
MSAKHSKLPANASSSHEVIDDVSSGKQTTNPETVKSKVSDSKSSDIDTSPVKIPAVKTTAETKNVEASAVDAGEAKKVESSSSGKSRKKKRSKETHEAGAAKKVKKDKKKRGRGGEETTKKVESSVVKSETKKRSIETDEPEASAKKFKGDPDEVDKKSGGEEEPQKIYFQRIWTEEDEITLLQGVIEYNKDYGNSLVDTNGFFERMKKSFSFEVNKSQFTEKLRGLKKKYIDKGKKTFAKAHDQRAFGLCNIIWGPDGILPPESAVKSKAKPDKSKKGLLVKEDDELPVFSLPKGELTVKRQYFVSIAESIVRSGVDESFVRRSWSNLAPEHKKTIEEQWKDLQVQNFSKQNDMIQKVVNQLAESSPSEVYSSFGSIF